MTKVSSNAGKHPYLRPDHEFLFDHLKNEKKGIKFDVNNQHKFVNVISTEYFDKNNIELFGGDTVTYKNVDHVITYDSREFCWIIENVNEPQKREILKKTAHLSVLKKKHN